MSWPRLEQFALAAFANAWLRKVNSDVPDPYLDEVFHVPQAQAYCKRQYHVWDSKITTPPGLYILVSIFQKFMQVSSNEGNCTTRNLRWINFIAVVVAIPNVVDKLYRALHRPSLPSALEGTEKSSSHGRLLKHLVPSLKNHTTYNISLFPPLFFFAALFYTEPWSVYLVLVGHPALRSRKSERRDLIPQNAIFIVQGIVALLFRQTNIFWVAVFYGGLDVVQKLEASAVQPRRPGKNMDKSQSLQAIVSRSWQSGHIYDPPVNDTWLEDYFKVAISLLVAAIRNPGTALMALTPYLILLGVFSAFVVWNGGVVLGDKSNHVTSLHLPQMLYIWPYFLFFSFPVLVGHAFRATLAQAWPSLPVQTRKEVFPRMIVVCTFMGIILSVVHFNTVVHPFILADNRHYVFYVFRWVLLRHPYTKYIVVPIYFVCGWVAITALGGPPNASTNNRKTVSASSKRVGNDKPVAERPNKASFVIIWLAATALSLITAPLVEPRYFILPWIMWRLYLPEFNQGTGVQGNDVASKTRIRGSASHIALGELSGCGYEKLLWFETGWLLLVNIVTMYIFFYHGFAWPQEPGKVQRFMW